MKAKTTLVVLVSSVIIFTLMLAIPNSVLAATAKPLPPIKIGIVQSLSGMVSDYALEDLEGFKVQIS